MKKIISTELAPKAIGPYSQGIAIGDLIFVSGQIPVDPKTGELVTGEDVIVAQTHQSLNNIKNILESQGMGFENVIKTTVFITDINDFNKVNSVYAEYFKEPYPARSCVQVAKLPKGALVEIEIIAHK
ncbi:2-iminobutanoate/2-iminopropanoate deaminase [Clostridium tetanomorphum]|uniref:RidA family protein n=1 Tax=Clostridium tetanomorphum TaxID=1553 RepID=A0A923EEA7_CLOTT|nr:RidA family protein [Clostridium tetanomorphum]KAJ49962.1 translation initiation inhibitor [Clostridium tetanomorphum DSM 665]MBC2399288.1 RidA family protein [Clostridium tetanomorphum]MBP1866092.1 2-iminobutanoate/2-iminopropanoate deaminase [Clostridium tetanomorphum]NRS86720.1 2-iminobutanoate/2-iminopropanoate deaminase [Clostridium tetanomorphum]NRZ99527.1 2-iminobutanoate/2-iminopropanoate deaminase [Clostridium tetanomorphum]